MRAVDHRRVRLRITLLLTAGGLLIAGCAGADTAELEQTINNQAAAQQALQSRMEEVESRLDTAADPPAELGQLRRRVEELTATVESSLEQLRADLDAESEARRAATAPLESGLGDLRSTVTSLSSQVQELTDQVQILREDVGSLRAQIRNQNS